MVLLWKNGVIRLAQPGGPLIDSQPSTGSPQVLQKASGDLLWIDFTESKLRSEEMAMGDGQIQILGLIMVDGYIWIHLIVLISAVDIGHTCVVIQCWICNEEPSATKHTSGISPGDGAYTKITLLLAISRFAITTRMPEKEGKNERKKERRKEGR